MECLNFFNPVIHSRDEDGIRNSVDPDHTAPLGAVSSGSAQFVHTYLS